MGKSRYLRIQFGRRNMPESFQRKLGKVLSGVCWRIDLVYINEIGSLRTEMGLIRAVSSSGARVQEIPHGRAMVGRRADWCCGRKLRVAGHRKRTVLHLPQPRGSRKPPQMLEMGLRTRNAEFWGKLYFRSERWGSCLLPSRGKGTPAALITLRVRGDA